MRVRDRYVYAALVAGLSLAATTQDAQAQQDAQAASERRLTFPTGQPSGLSGSYWAAALANGGPAPRHERLLAVRPDGRVLGVIDGERDYVMLSVALVRELSEQKLQATLVHNHPTSVGLGESDLMHLAKMGVSRIVAVGSDGTVYEAAAGSRYDPARFAENLYPAVESRVRERLAAEAWRDREDPEALSPHVPHLVAVVLHRARVIDYLVTPSETVKLAFARYRELFERVVVAEGHHLEDEIENLTKGRRQRAEGKGKV
jgi:hypothetical protein